MLWTSLIIAVFETKTSYLDRWLLFENKFLGIAVFFISKLGFSLSLVRSPARLFPALASTLIIGTPITPFEKKTNVCMWKKLPFFSFLKEIHVIEVLSWLEVFVLFSVIDSHFNFHLFLLFFFQVHLRDQFRFQGSCPLTPPLSRHYLLLLTLGKMLA